eukprot:Nitzschia sp. Nitz4//scaffold15_size197535//47736//48332//NITZ4_001564-RA/size197535-augustus-gene-0.222-mRNA-1//-1//CDS//3329537673//5089//frame0
MNPSFEVDDNFLKNRNHSQGMSGGWNSVSLGDRGTLTGSGCLATGTSTGPDATRIHQDTPVLPRGNTIDMQLDVNPNIEPPSDDPDRQLGGGSEEFNQKSSSPEAFPDEDADAWKELPLWVQELSELRASMERASVHNAILLDKLYRCGAVNKLDDFY